MLFVTEEDLAEVGLDEIPDCDMLLLDRLRRSDQHPDTAARFTLFEAMHHYGSNTYDGAGFGW